jgi:MinD superfamily P-loop ATPase
MWITVASGKGGTGKTTVSVSLALSAKNGVYVDADVEEPNGALFLKPSIEKTIPYTEPIPQIDTNICTFCGKCADACVYKAIVILKPLKKAMFFPELCHSCGLCAYVCPVKGALTEVPRKKGTIRFGKSDGIQFIEGTLDLGESSATPLIRGMKKYIPRNNVNVIIDAPPGTSCPVVEAMEDSDFVVLVTEPTLFGLNDLKLTVSLVRELALPFGVIINKSEENNFLIDHYAEDEKIPILGRIPFSLSVAEDYSKGIPAIYALKDGKKVFRAIFEKIKEITGNEQG